MTVRAGARQVASVRDCVENQRVELLGTKSMTYFVVNALMTYWVIW